MITDSEIAIDALGAEFADNRFTEQSSDVFRNLETVTLAKVHDAEGILDLDEKVVHAIFHYSCLHFSSLRFR